MFRRLRRRLLRPVIANVIAATATANDQYVRRNPICSFAMASIAYVLLLFMLMNASSMLEIYIIEVAIVMICFLKLIMKLSNYPTKTTAPNRAAEELYSSFKSSSSPAPADPSPPAPLFS